MLKLHFFRKLSYYHKTLYFNFYPMANCFKFLAANKKNLFFKTDFDTDFKEMLTKIIK